jgi:hypothetical protein
VLIPEPDSSGQWLFLQVTPSGLVPQSGGSYVFKTPCPTSQPLHDPSERYVPFTSPTSFAGRVVSIENGSVYYMGQTTDTFTPASWEGGNVNLPGFPMTCFNGPGSWQPPYTAPQPLPLPPMTLPLKLVLK